MGSMTDLTELGSCVDILFDAVEDGIAVLQEGTVFAAAAAS